jgi:hypothetical protein
VGQPNKGTLIKSNPAREELRDGRVFAVLLERSLQRSGRWEMNPYRIVALSLLAFALLTPPTPATGPLQFYSVTPCRLVDTRDANGPSGGPALAGGATRAFPVFGQFARPCGIPSTAKAVFVNAAVVAPSGPGYITLWANNAAWPATSNLNYNAGEPALANGALVKLTYPPSDLVDPNYQIAVISGANTHLVLDITGYYQ